MPRVAFILSQFPEMHETFILRELVALDDAGLDFVIFSLKPCRDAVVQSAAERFAKRTFYPWGAVGAGRLARAVLSSGTLPWVRHPVKSAYVTWAASRLARAVRSLGVGHLHAHWATAPTSAALVISRMMGVPFSFTAHAWDIFAGDGRLAEKARAAEFIVTCTGANVNAIAGMIDPADRPKVILNYHGIPEGPKRIAAGSGSGPLRIAAVGRLVETKGFEHLVDSLGLVDFALRLVIVGDGPARGALEKRARRFGDDVRFEGIVANERVFEILAESDVFVMPSVIARNGDRDGIPNVMLEAMSLGLPVVASAISGIPEAVRDGSNGILVPPGDPVAIADALLQIRRDPAAATRMGAEGRSIIAETFSAEKNAGALHRIFERYLCAGEK